MSNSAEEPKVQEVTENSQEQKVDVPVEPLPNELTDEELEFVKANRELFSTAISRAAEQFSLLATQQLTLLSGLYNLDRLKELSSQGPFVRQSLSRHRDLLVQAQKAATEAADKAKAESSVTDETPNDNVEAKEEVNVESAEQE